MLKSGVVLFTCMVNDMKRSWRVFWASVPAIGLMSLFKVSIPSDELLGLCLLGSLYWFALFVVEQFDTYFSTFLKVAGCYINQRYRAKRGLAEPTEEQNRLLAEAEEIVNRTKAQLEQSKKDDIRLHEIKQRIAAIDIERAK